MANLIELQNKNSVRKGQALTYIKGYSMRIDPARDASQIVVHGRLLPEIVNVSFESRDTRGPRRLPPIRLSYRISETAIECTLLWISSGKDVGPITTTVFRNINVQRIGTETLQEVYSSAPLAPGTPAIEPLPPGRAGQMANLAVGGAVTDKELHYVALIYCSPSPVPGKRVKRAKSVMRMLGYGSQPTADKRIAAARQAGYIPPVGASEKEMMIAFAKASNTIGQDQIDE